MAASSVVNGNDIGVYVEGSLIGCLTGATFNSKNLEVDVTCKDNAGAKAVLPAGNEATISFEGLFNPASTYGAQELVTVHVNKTRVWVKMGDNTNLTVTGYAYLNEMTWTAPLNAGSVFSGVFTIDGGYTNSQT